MLSKALISLTPLGVSFLNGSTDNPRGVTMTIIFNSVVTLADSYIKWQVWSLLQISTIAAVMSVIATHLMNKIKLIQPFREQEQC